METRDSIGNVLTKEQIEYFKDSKIRDKSGNLLVCYHGTQNPGFKEFNPSAIEGQFGKYKFNNINVNFFTLSKDVAAGYTEHGYERDGNIYACYLNVVNPFVLNNESTDDIKSWKNIKNTDIRKGLIDAFKKFWNKWNSKNSYLDEDDVDEINKDLFYFNHKIINSMDRTDKNVQGYGQDPEWYDVLVMSENTMLGVEHTVMPSYSLEELFDDDMYEEWRDTLVGDFESEEYKDDYWLTTNDVIRYVLLLNANGANYDGIIIPDIFDSGPTGSIFNDNSTDIITLGSPNQIKEITNKNPTSSNKIDEDKLYFVNKKVTEKLIRTERFDMFVTQSPYEAKNYLLSKTDPQRIFIDENIPLYLIGEAYECVHRDLIDTAVEQGWKTKMNDFDPKVVCAIFSKKNEWGNPYFDEREAWDDEYEYSYWFADFVFYSRYIPFGKFELYKVFANSFGKPYYAHGPRYYSGKYNESKINEKVSPAGYEPKKTGKAYKVFKVKNGKLYPPMVANPSGADTPVGVWLDAEEGEFAGLSKTGRPQVKSTGSGTLSYRPGWHLGDVPRAKQFDRLNKETGEYEFPKDFVWAECDYAMDVDYQPESDARGYERTKIDDNGNVVTYRSDKYQHSLAGLPKIPSNGYYKYRTNPNPDTVPWVITGQMKVNKLLSDDEVNAILRQNGIEPIHRQGGDKTLAELGLKESIRESFTHVDGDYTYEEVDKWLKNNYKWSSSPNKATGAQLIDKEGKFIQTKKEEYHGDILNKMVKAGVIKLGTKYLDNYNLVNTDLLSGLGYVRCNNEDAYEYLQLPNRLTSAQMSSLENWLYKYFTNKRELLDIECPVRKQYVRYFLDDDFHSWSTTNAVYGGTLDELIDMLENFNRGASLREKKMNESLLTEKTRQELISKSRSGDNYSVKNQAKGKNRWERRKYSQIANSIRDYNNIDMNTFWKEDILEFKINIHGETDDYLVTIIFENILRELQNEVKSNNNKFEFKSVLRALLKSFNSDNVYISCTCPDWKYRMNYWAAKGKYNSAIPDRWTNVAPLPHGLGGAAGANDRDTKGAGCKHVNLVLANTDWMMKVASVINNYAKWCKQNMTRNYADYIFPQIYGMPYDKAIQLSIFDDLNDNGLLPSDQETITKIIDKNLSNRDEKGKWIKGNDYRFKSNPNRQKQMKPEENPDQIKLKLNKNKQLQLPNEEEEENG